MVGAVIGHVRLKDAIEHTRNLFEPVTVLAGKELLLLERNEAGDCLCMYEGRYLVDVDHRDIVEVVRNRPPTTPTSFACWHRP